MNRFLNAILFIGFFVLFGAVGCAKKAVPVKSVEKEITDYSDDLSKYRISQKSPTHKKPSKGEDMVQNKALVSEHDISSRLNIVLDTISSRNKALGYLSGYTILVYSGASRIEADRIINKLFDIVGAENEPLLQYNLPNFFVKIGQYHEQIEAQQLYLEIRPYYPDATIVPEKFKVNEPKE